jgi:hypothetical protein
MGVKSLKNGGSYSNIYASNDVKVELLLIGGGGGSARNASNVYSASAGGGAGGVLYVDKYLMPLGSYSVVIGAGGSAGSNGVDGNIGDNTTFGSYVAYGGGGGSADTQTSSGPWGGGSEGGYSSLIPGQWYKGGGVRGQGNPVLIGSGNNSGTGGAGSWAPGYPDWTRRQQQGGFGGQGTGEFHEWLSATSTGELVNSRRYIAGGGGGGHALYYGTPYNHDNGGIGGGGNGGGYATNSTAGAANTGGGGGGNGSTGTAGQYSTNSAGGSGLAIVRYLTGALTATGGTIVTSGGYTYHTFTSNGTFTRTA